MEEKCDVSGMGELDAPDREALSRRTREILHQCYKFGFEYHKELDRLVTGQVRELEGYIQAVYMYIYVYIDIGCFSKMRKWCSSGPSCIVFKSTFYVQSDF